MTGGGQLLGWYGAAVGAADRSVAVGAQGERVGCVPGRAQHVEKAVAVLGPGDAVRAVDDDEGRAGGAQALGAGGIVAHLPLVAVLGERPAGALAVQADLLAQAEQVVHGEDGAGLAEVGAEDRVPGLAVPALGGGVGEELVRQVGVADQVVQHLVGGEPLGRGQRLDPTRGRLRLGTAHAVPAQQRVTDAERLTHGEGTAQRERVVDDFHLIAVLEPLHGTVQTVAAQPAPGAGDLGPDVDLHDAPPVPTL